MERASLHTTSERSAFNCLMREFRQIEFVFFAVFFLCMHYTPIVWNLILHFYYVQIYTKTSLDHLHSKVHLIHTDTKPENILLVANNADEGDVRIKIIDMGSAVFGCERCDCNHDNNNNSCDGYRDGLRTSIVNTRQYRAPEILLRTGWSYPSDVWAAGECLPNVEHDIMMHQSIYLAELRWQLLVCGHLLTHSYPSRNRSFTYFTRMHNRRVGSRMSFLPNKEYERAPCNDREESWSLS